MTRPTVLDMDLVVVPREAAQVMLDEVTAADQHEPFSDTTMSGIFDSMLSASPYSTAWDDVRRYVEGLETDLSATALRLDAVRAGMASAYASKHEMIGKFDYQYKRAFAAEARIAELEKRLADAERVIKPFARAVKYSEALNRQQPDEPKSRPHDFLISDEIRAARAYMEGK